MSAKWSLLVLLTLVLGCEHHMGSAGFIGMALDKDRRAQEECDMPDDKWRMLCKDVYTKKDPTTERCPPECWPPPPGNN